MLPPMSVETSEADKVVAARHAKKSNVIQSAIMGDRTKRKLADDAADAAADAAIIKSSKTKGHQKHLRTREPDPTTSSSTSSTVTEYNKKLSDNLNLFTEFNAKDFKNVLWSRIPGTEIDVDTCNEKMNALHWVLDNSQLLIKNCFVRTLLSTPISDFMIKPTDKPNTVLFVAKRNLKTKKNDEIAYYCSKEAAVIIYYIVKVACIDILIRRLTDKNPRDIPHVYKASVYTDVNVLLHQSTLSRKDLDKSNKISTVFSEWKNDAERLVKFIKNIL